MIIKDKFTLIKEIPNELNLSSNIISTKTIKNSFEKVKSILEMIEDRIEHFSKKRVYSLLLKKHSFQVISLPDYPLAVSYNKPTKSIIINLSYFGVNDITPTNPNPRDLYACLVYGICLSQLMSKKYELPSRFFTVISSYLLSVFIRIYGKDYGLLGYYSTQIPKLKFVLQCYVLASFFGEKNSEELYKQSSVGLSYRYQNDIEILSKLDFSDITGLIQALSDLNVMPGLNKYQFTAKILRFLTINFIPALEDCSRFLATIVTSDVPGVTFTPSFIYRYNEDEYNKLIKISEMIFK